MSRGVPSTAATGAWVKWYLQRLKEPPPWSTILFARMPSFWEDIGSGNCNESGNSGTRHGRRQNFVRRRNENENNTIIKDCYRQRNRMQKFNLDYSKQSCLHTSPRTIPIPTITIRSSAYLFNPQRTFASNILHYSTAATATSPLQPLSSSSSSSSSLIHDPQHIPPKSAYHNQAQTQQQTYNDAVAANIILPSTSALISSHPQYEQHDILEPTIPPSPSPLSDQVSLYTPKHYNAQLHDPTFLPSNEQLEIFDTLVAGEFDVLVVDAKAGSGKTTTIIESLKYLPRGANVALLAYNKNIAQLLHHRATIAAETYKLPIRISSRTFHSVGYDLWEQYLQIKGKNAVHVSDTKTFDLFKELIDTEYSSTPPTSTTSPLSPSELARQLANTRPKRLFTAYHDIVIDLVSKAKLHGLAPKGTLTNGLLADTNEVWSALIEHYGIHLDPYAHDKELLIEFCRKVLIQSIAIAGGNAEAYSDSSTTMTSPPSPLFSNASTHPDGKYVVDYDDLIYLPIIHDVKFNWQYDYVFVDEAQDMSEIRVEMVERLRGNWFDTSPNGDLTKNKNGKTFKGRLITFGDRFQAIYGFAGCTSDFFAALHRMGNDSDSKSDSNESERHSESSAVSTLSPSSPPPPKIKVLNLSTCYRCPVKVIDLARTFVSDIQPRSEAPLGEVLNLHYDWSYEYFHQQSSMILSREMTPLVNFGFTLLKRKVVFGFMGRDIGPWGAWRLIKDVMGDAIKLEKMKNLHGVVRDVRIVCDDEDKSEMTMEEFVERVLVYRELMLSGELCRVDDLDVTALEDRFDSLLTILVHARQLNSSSRPLFNTVMDFFHYFAQDFLRPYLSSYQPDGFPKLLLSTMHQSRGLERDHVFLLNEGAFAQLESSVLGSGFNDDNSSSTFPSLPRRWHFWKWRTKGILPTSWEISQEKNLLYVSWTRAKLGLYFFEWDGVEKNRYVVGRRRSALHGRVVELRKRPWLNEARKLFRGLELELELDYGGSSSSSSVDDGVDGIRRQKGRVEERGVEVLFEEVAS